MKKDEGLTDLCRLQSFFYALLSLPASQPTVDFPFFITKLKPTFARISERGDERVCKRGTSG
jgi:hypothetical protein